MLKIPGVRKELAELRKPPRLKPEVLEKANHFVRGGIRRPTGEAVPPFDGRVDFGGFRSDRAVLKSDRLAQIRKGIPCEPRKEDPVQH